MLLPFVPPMRAPTFQLSALIFMKRSRLLHPSAFRPKLIRRAPRTPAPSCLHSETRPNTDCYRYRRDPPNGPRDSALPRPPRDDHQGGAAPNSAEAQELGKPEGDLGLTEDCTGRTRPAFGTCVWGGGNCLGEMMIDMIAQREGDLTRR